MTAFNPIATPAANNSRHDVLRHRRGMWDVSRQRGEYLTNVWVAAWKNGRVHAGPGNPGDGNGGPHHHGALVVMVPASKAAVMAEVMDFMGAIVDQADDVIDCNPRVLGRPRGDNVMLRSRGYWAHDFG